MQTVSGLFSYCAATLIPDILGMKPLKGLTGCGSTGWMTWSNFLALQWNWTSKQIE